MKSNTRKLVFSAMLAALACVATYVIRIPSPLSGYINLGDCIVLLAGWLLSPLYGFLAAGIGVALADLFAGYAIYAPATFVIKGIMAVIAYYGFNFMKNKLGSIASYIISGALAECAMVLGYLLFESFLYGFVPSLVNVSPNSVQGIVGLVISLILVNIFKKNNILNK